MVEAINLVAWAALVIGLVVTYLLKKPKIGYGFVVAWFLLVMFINIVEGRYLWALGGLLIIVLAILVPHIMQRRKH